MFNMIDMGILVLILTLQVHNLVKYKNKDGAIKQRIVMLLSIVFLLAHVIRLEIGITTGFFLLLHVLTWLLLYHPLETLINDKE